MKNKGLDYPYKRIGAMFSVAIMFIILGTSISCSGDGEDLAISLEGPVLSVSDFTGNWTATSAIFESIDVPGNRLDIIEEGGSATLTVQANGRFAITINTPGLGLETFSGELGFNGEEYGDRLIVVFDGDARDDYELFNIGFENNVLFLSGITTFDFTGNGTEESAVIDLGMVRS
ncbi:hypothetical protein [Ulvibacterium marinum]|uniref:Uncharacterized protein n=1 Tax=Ulvibacterium marinum TaxID=2419782 RepID=A0A3B0C4A0_9FLAO|nr:hypothetical protein [Ulvibacterium marinum]RKN79311.1 hypothetical protein D7Z94_13380 [Ulvibacterium marinum]